MMKLKSPPEPLGQFQPSCANFGWKWLVGFGGGDFKISSKYFSYFILSPLWGGHGPSFEQT